MALACNHKSGKTNCHSPGTNWYAFCLYYCFLALTWEGKSMIRISQILAKVGNLTKSWKCHWKSFSVHDHRDPVVLSVTNVSMVPNFIVRYGKKPSVATNEVRVITQDSTHFNPCLLLTPLWRSLSYIKNFENVNCCYLLRELVCYLLRVHTPLELELVWTLTQSSNPTSYSDLTWSSLGKFAQLSAKLNTPSGILCTPSEYLLVWVWLWDMLKNWVNLSG